MTCANPLDFGTLADYWAAVLPEPEEQAIEEHLFDCDPCGDRLREIASIAAAVRDLARRGSLLMIVSDSFLQRVATEGFHIREYAPTAGGSIACTVTAEDDFLVGRLAADLRAAGRIDLSLSDPLGAERMRLPDIPFDSQAGSVIFQQPIEYAKAAPSETIVARLLKVDDAGVEHLLGEYTFVHTRTMPGPPGW